MNSNFPITHPNSSHENLYRSSSIDLEAVLKENPTPTIIINPKGNIIFLNKAAEDNHFFKTQEKKIFDVFPDLSSRTDTKLTTRITLPNQEKTELFFCPCTEDQTVVYINESSEPQSKVEQLLRSKLKPSDRRPSSPAPNLGSGSQELLQIVNRVVNQNLDKITEQSYLPAYQQKGEGAEEEREACSHLSSRSSSPFHLLTRSNSPLSSPEATKAQVILLTQLLFSTVHKIRNCLVPAFFNVGQLEKLVKEEPIHNSSPLKEVISGLRASLEEIKTLMDEQVECESPTKIANTQTFTKKKMSKKEMKILVAEDEPISFKVLEKVLSGLGFITIKRAKNGKEAVEMIKENPNFDLIFMDIHMPEMDGNKAAKAIREISMVPIIACTGSAEAEIEKSYFTEIIIKPWQKALLNEKIESIFSFTEKATPD